MKNRFAVSIICLELILGLPGWAQTPAPAPAPTPAAAAPAAPAPPEEPRSVLAVPEGYRYDSNGRRDPFVNPIPKPPAAAVPVVVKAVRPPGLKGALLSEVAVMGVYIAKNDAQMTRAVLQVPGMKAPLLASRGDVLFDAAIKEIRPDGVVFARVASGDAPANPSEPRELLKTVRSAGDKK